MTVPLANPSGGATARTTTLRTTTVTSTAVRTGSGGTRRSREPTG